MFHLLVAAVEAGLAVVEVLASAVLGGKEQPKDYHLRRCSDEVGVSTLLLLYCLHRTPCFVAKK